MAAKKRFLEVDIELGGMGRLLDPEVLGWAWNIAHLLISSLVFDKKTDDRWLTRSTASQLGRVAI